MRNKWVWLISVVIAALLIYFFCNLDLTQTRAWFAQPITSLKISELILILLIVAIVLK
jgi:hypothetical protein